MQVDAELRDKAIITQPLFRCSWSDSVILIICIPLSNLEQVVAVAVVQLLTVAALSEPSGSLN